MRWYLEVWQRYAEFSGRSCRMEYWMFALFSTIIAFVLYVPGLLPQSQGSVLMLFFYAAYGLAALVPSFAVTIRRLHDTNRSGWWILIALVPIAGSLVLLVFLAIDGTRGSNRYGPDPKLATQPAAIG